MSSASPPDTVKCVYCSKCTPSYQLICQIPKSFAPQEFILKNLLSFDGGTLKTDDYICFEHEETFRIKYRSMLNGHQYTKSYNNRYNNISSSDDTNMCAVCRQSSINVHRMSKINLQFKDFLINHAQVMKNKVTRKGTGLSEMSILCNPCYRVLKRKFADVTYTPKKTTPKPAEVTSESAVQDYAHKNVDGSVVSITPTCVVCGEGKSRNKEQLRTLTETLETKIEDLKQYSDTTLVHNIRKNSSSSHVHKGGRKKCYELILSEYKGLEISHNTQKGPDSDNMSNIGVQSHENHEVDIDCDGEFDRIKYFQEVFSQNIQKQVADEVPIRLPTVLQEKSEYVELVEETNEVTIGAPTRREFESIISNYLESNPTFSIHTASNKHGRLLYNKDWDIIQHIYELKSDENQTAERFMVNSKSNKISPNSMFYCMKELKEHIKAATDFCEIYGRYPELMKSLNLEEILFTGLEVKIDEETATIPPLDPVLFNFFYFLTCSDSEEKEFETSYSPEGYTSYSEGYSDKNKIIYCRVLGLIFDLLHQQNKDNVYPFPMLFSELIANSTPTKLMDYFSRHRKCASPRKYEEYKKTMASQVKKRKEEGDIMGLIAGKFTALHMDNLEKYQPHVRNPAEALTSSLVIAGQQPLPSKKIMSLEIGDDIDSHATLSELDESELATLINETDPDATIVDDDTHVVITDLLTDLIQRVETGMAEDVMTTAEEIQWNEGRDEDGYKSDSYCSQVSEFSQSTTTSQDTESSEVIEAYVSPVKTRSKCVETSVAETSRKRPLFDLPLESRRKRLKYDYEVINEPIAPYVAPELLNKEKRHCKLTDFELSEEEKALVESLNFRLLTHTLLQVEGKEGTEESLQQYVPSFKETIAWDQPVVEKSNTAYLELIPGKPDHIDTIYYALCKIKELFVDRLGYKYVSVCGDGKTVNVLYKIKDEYGNHMSWMIVMLGSWHMLKSYLEVFFKKYENVFIRHLLSKIISKGNVDAIINCKNWSKSNNFAFWMMSSLLREYTSEFLNHLTESERHDLSSKVETAVNILKQTEKPSLKDVQDFSTATNNIMDIMHTNKQKIDSFGSNGAANDDQFALFKQTLDDFSAYVTVYISIRTSNWDLRNAGIKMMATRFVRSNATLYKWLVTRHLADIATTYPKEILNRLKSGGWVSALKDGRGVTLARDEYHERTASRDIKLVLPKQLTKQNMEVITQYLTYGAKVRNNFLSEFFSIKSSGFELAKGCSRKWLANQEKLVGIFSSMIEPVSPFRVESRLLHQPFTNLEAKLSLKKDFLGRENFGEATRDNGRDVLISYVSPLFCNRAHNIDTEKQSMKKRCMHLFPVVKSKSEKKKSNALKEREEIIQVLAASVVKLSESPNTEDCKLAGCQLNVLPGLFAETEETQFRKMNKSDIRERLEKRYATAFMHPTIQYDDSVYIKDGMQDLFMLPLLHHVSFSDYFSMWWDNKVRRHLHMSPVVVLDFDKQIHSERRPKENLHIIRDGESQNNSVDFCVNDDSVIPVGKKDWNSFLANRANKKGLVHYLCEKMKVSNHFLKINEKVIVSFEGDVFEVSSEETHELVDLKNNHNESDTRVFFLLTKLPYETSMWVIRSTDTDILFTALLNYDKLFLQSRNIYIHYNNIGQGQKFCSINELVKSIENEPRFSLLYARSAPVPMFVGLLHFISGCDDLSFLRGFSKKFCFDTFLRHCDLIFPNSAEEFEQILNNNEEELFQFLVRFLACIYSNKFTCSLNAKELATSLTDLPTNELLSLVRKRTWHKTIYCNNTMPSDAAIKLHSKRLGYVLSSFGYATTSHHSLPDPTLCGWIDIVKDNIHKLVPEWDSEESKKEINVIRKTMLKKCACQKNSCKNKRCSCKKSGNICTTLCSCMSCQNIIKQASSVAQIHSGNKEDHEDKEGYDNENESEVDGEDDNERDGYDEEEEDGEEEDDEKDDEEGEEGDEGEDENEEDLNEQLQYLEFQNDMFMMTQQKYMIDIDDEEIDYSDCIV